MYELSVIYVRVRSSQAQLATNDRFLGGGVCVCGTYLIQTERCPCQTHKFLVDLRMPLGTVEAQHSY